MCENNLSRIYELSITVQQRGVKSPRRLDPAYEGIQDYTDWKEERCGDDVDASPCLVSHAIAR